MRLCFAIKALSQISGGAERVLSQIASGLARADHDVTLISYDAPGSIDFYPVDPLVRRVRLGIGDTLRHSSPNETLRRMPALRRAVLESGADVAVGFMHSMYVPLAFTLVGTSIPIVASEHASYDHYLTRPLQRALLHLAAPLLARITIPSQLVRAGFPEPLRKRMEVVGNVVAGSSNALADPLGGTRKRLLSVGRLAHQKDHRTLIEAFRRVAAAHPAWDLRIVGEGELRPALEAQIAALGLESRVTLAKATNDIDVEYCHAQLFVLSSLYESFGLATAEALAHGLAAIGFADCPGTNELIIHERNGLLVDGPDRAAALAMALDRLMGNDSMRAQLAAAAPDTINELTVDRVVASWGAVAQAAVAQRRGRTC